MTYDLAIIGAGIVGLAHAWTAAQRGRRVGLFERGRLAAGASVRNFGMIWPIGQPAGDARNLALRSRDLWVELAAQAGLWVRRCGSLHLARRPDELAVLEEFSASLDAWGFARSGDLRMLTPNEVARRSPAANGDGLLGALWSDDELCVDPREAIARLPLWLAERHGVELHFESTIVRAGGGELQAAGGRTWRAEQILICSGAEMQLLFPAELADCGLQLCKLQMLKTAPQSPAWQLGPHLAGGLTLRHYASFNRCASLAALRDRIAAETPELDRFGIHVMASQNRRGEVVLGDSHQYGDEITPFDLAAIEERILIELRSLMRLPDWTIGGRWHGVYAKHPELPIVRREAAPGVWIMTGTGGAGMTLGLGLAEQFWDSTTRP